VLDIGARRRGKELLGVRMLRVCEDGLAAALLRGFTAVRDVAGGDVGLASAIEEGLYPGPRYFFTGPALSQTGGHGDIRAANHGGCFHGGHMCEVVDGADD